MTSSIWRPTRSPPQNEWLRLPKRPCSLEHRVAIGPSGPIQSVKMRGLKSLPVAADTSEKIQDQSEIIAEKYCAGKKGK